MIAMDPTEHAGHVWHETRGPGSACKRCGLYYSSWSGDRCPKAPHCDAVFRPDVTCDRELGHPGEHRAEVEWPATPYASGLGFKDQVNAVVAAVTEHLHSGPADQENYLRMSAPALRQVPPDSAFHISTTIIHVLLWHLAERTGRDVQDVWRHIALSVAEGIPEDGGGERRG